MTYRTDLNAEVGGTGSPGAVEADRPQWCFTRRRLGALPFFCHQSLSVEAAPSSTTKSIPEQFERGYKQRALLCLLSSVLLAMDSAVLLFFFFTPERISVLWEQSPPREDNSQPGREVELKQFLPLEQENGGESGVNPFCSHLTAFFNLGEPELVIPWPVPYCPSKSFSPLCGICHPGVPLQRPVLSAVCEHPVEEVFNRRGI